MNIANPTTPYIVDPIPLRIPNSTVCQKSNICVSAMYGAKLLKVSMISWFMDHFLIIKALKDKKHKAAKAPQNNPPIRDIEAYFLAFKK